MDIHREQTIIFDRMVENIELWKLHVKSVDDFTIKRLSGLSNACFRVQIKEGHCLEIEDPQTRTILYRRFELDLTDKRIEQAIFLTKSEDGTGPKLHHQAKEYRIEGFFHGRPLTIWELGNPMVYKAYANMICDFNFSEVAQERI